MNHENSFNVTRYANRNGVISWRVAGWLHGVRIRKNFKTREEASAEKATLEIRAEQVSSGLTNVVTCLTVDQVRQAEAVFRSLEGRTGSLASYVTYALTHCRDSVKDQPLDTAVSEYLRVREGDERLNRLSHRQFVSFRCELRALKTQFRGEKVSSLTAPKLTEFFNRGQAARKTFNNRRNLVGAFLSFCYVQDWIPSNPISKVQHFRGLGHRRGSASTLSAAKCADLMAWTEKNHDGALVPFAALCLFAGIRPDLYQGEIAKLRPEHIRLDTGVILIEPEVSKVRMKRNITIQPNLAEWFRAYPLEQYPIMPRGFKRLRLEFRKHFNLTHDILRHTFISMFVAKYRSMGEAALQAGNSESIIRKHYLDLKSPAEAEQFFGILPSRKVTGTTSESDASLSPMAESVAA